MAVALKIVSEGGELSVAVQRLLDFCHHVDRDGAPWAGLRKIEFVADAASIQQQLSEVLSSDAVPPSFTGLYFGLDGLNMRKGKGLEFGCSTEFSPGRSDDDWVYRCERYPTELKSAALTKLYKTIECGSTGDLALGLGYTGLALRKAFESIPLDILLGGARERAIVWGFHDGDLFRLGKVCHDGFTVELNGYGRDLADAAPEIPVGPPPRKPRVKTVPFKWGNLESPSTWLSFAITYAPRVKKEFDRRQAWERIAWTTEKARPLQEMIDVGTALAEQVTGIEDPDSQSTVALTAARVLAAAGQIETAQKLFVLSYSAALASNSYSLSDKLESIERAAGPIPNLGWEPPFRDENPEIPGLSAALWDVSRGALTGASAIGEALDRAEAAIQAARTANGERRPIDIAEYKLAWTCVLLGDNERAVRLIRALKFPKPNSAVLAQLQWKAGLHEEASTTFAAALKSELESSEAGNFDHVGVFSIADDQWKLGDSKGFLSTITEIDKHIRVLRFSPATAAVVISGMGRILGHAGLSVESSRVFLAAREIAATLPADYRANVAWRTLSSDYFELGRWEDALECANRIAFLPYRRLAMAPPLVRLGRLQEVQKQTLSARLPQERADLATTGAKTLIARPPSTAPIL